MVQVGQPAEICVGYQTKKINMAAPSFRPIISPTHYDPSFKVDIQLHEPLLSRGFTPSDVRLDMTSLCYQLETLCKKEAMQQATEDYGHISNSFIDRATVVHDRMLTLMSKAPAEYQDCLRYIQWQGLDILFPRTVVYLRKSKKSKTLSFDPNKTVLDNYFTSLSQLNQLSTIARQIHNDCNNSCHKYVAHQIAILYQTISSIKSPAFSQHKQSIEDMFKSIKATLAGSGDNQRGCLTQEQQDWLFGITSSILQTIGAFPADLTQEMLQPAMVFTKQYVR